ncbi:MAG: carbohydrate kinase family protein [Candidatus Fimenecus sp.]
MSEFVAGAGATNVDLLYKGFPRLPKLGEEIYCDDFSLQLGGGVPATLINLGRLGIEARIATELGDDMFSRFAQEKFQENGVNPVNLYTGDKIPLNITSAIILPEDRTFFTYGKGSIEPSDEALETFYQTATGAKVVLMQPGGFLPVYEQLKAEGSIMVLDTGWDENLSFDAYGKYLKIADYYTPNRKEALQITGEPTPERAAERLHTYFDKVVVKVDKDGCIGSENGQQFFVKSVAAFQNVDSTGAGDAFLAGFIYGLVHDAPFSTCIAYGNITGGKAVTAVGALSAYVTAEELHTLYQAYFA